MSNIIIRKYIKHNENNFSNKVEDEKNKILIEFNGWSHAHIWISYLANCLAKKHKEIIDRINNFINSKKFRFNKTDL